MPRCDDDSLPPLSRQLKFQLIDLARELHLADNGTVTDLRQRIRDHLTGSPKLLATPRYANLVPSLHPHQLQPSSPLQPPPPLIDPRPTNACPRIPNEIPDRRRAFRDGTSSTVIPVKRRQRMIPGCAPVVYLFVIPEVVVKEVVRGWLEHIPLTYLTDQFCLLDSGQQIKHREVRIDEHNQLIATVCLLHDDPEEYKLSFEDWLEAFSRFLDLLQTFLPSLHDLWESHFDRICHAPDRTSNWSTWLSYDIYIRRVSTEKGVDPTIFHQQVWFGLYRESLKKFISRLGPYNPYDDQSRPCHTQERLPHRCLRCGGPHSARGCYADTLVNGLPVVIPPREDGRSDCDVDGNRYCLSFNGSTGCSNTSCHKGLHWCSLCTGLEHNAQSCPFI